MLGNRKDSDFSNLGVRNGKGEEFKAIIYVETTMVNFSISVPQ